MRREIFIGLSLAAAAFIGVLLSSWLGLEVEATILLGVAVGAVVGLVPDRSTAMRLVGFAAGFVIAWIGYVLRAAKMPDSASGQAVVVALTILLCLGVALASTGRIPLWTLLLGAGAFSGAYELTYVDAPPEVVSTSLSVATSMILSVAIGFLAVAWIGPEPAPQPGRRGRFIGATDPQRDDKVPFNSMMDKR
jgi:hypothetical protein